MPDAADRLRTYSDLSSLLAQYDERQLLALLTSRRIDNDSKRIEAYLRQRLLVPTRSWFFWSTSRTPYKTSFHTT